MSSGRPGSGQPAEAGLQGASGAARWGPRVRADTPTARARGGARGGGVRRVRPRRRPGVRRTRTGDGRADSHHSDRGPSPRASRTIRTWPTSPRGGRTRRRRRRSPRGGVGREVAPRGRRSRRSGGGAGAYSSVLAERCAGESGGRHGRVRAAVARAGDRNRRRVGAMARRNRRYRVCNLSRGRSPTPDVPSRTRCEPGRRTRAREWIRPHRDAENRHLVRRAR